MIVPECKDKKSMETSMAEPKTDLFLLGSNPEVKTEPPVLALVIGSGASALEVHKFRKRIRALGYFEKEQSPKVVVIGVNYSYRLFLAENHIFLDWEFWSQNTCDIEKLVKKFGVHMFAPMNFATDRVKRSPAPPIPPEIHRFMPFLCTATGCKYCKSPLSDHPIKGLRGSATSVMPAINLAFLSGAKIIAIIGVEMDNSYHFWQVPEWQEIKGEIEHLDEFHGLWLDLYGAVKRTDKFPNAAFSLKDIKKVGKWLRRKQKVRAINCAPNGIVKGWERLSLEKTIELAEKAALSSSSATARA